MPDPAVHRLRCRWNDYLKITQNERSKKAVALDRFLGEFICNQQLTGEGNVHKVCNEFSDMKSVSNLLAGELLVDVHHVCSTSDDDDTSQLQQYLLYGRGATLLKVLNTIGVQGVSCNRELGDLLATLLPLCCKFPCANDDRNADWSLAHIDTCFSHLKSRQARKPISKFPTLTEVRSTSNTHNVDVHTPWPPQRLPVRKKHSSGTEESSDSNADDGPSQLLQGIRHSSMLHPGGATGALGVFPGLLQDQPDEDGITEPTQETNTFPVKLNPVELCLTMLELMQSLCQGDTCELAQTRIVSFTVLPHLSHLLFSLVTETVAENQEVPEGWTLSKQLLLARSLTRATLTVMSHASIQPNGISYLGTHGCVLQLVEAAKVFAKNLPLSKSESMTWSETEIEMLLFVDDVMYGLMMLIHTMLQSIPLNPSILNSSLKLLNNLCDHGLQLLQVVLVHWERLLSSSDPHSTQYTLAKEHIISTVTSLGHVMSSLKKAKVDFIHMMKCVKRRHRSCEFSHYMHHHHDILGISSSAFADYLVTMSDSYGSMEVLSAETPDMPGQNECMVAVLSEFLLQVLVDSQTRLLQIRILSCIEEAGLCCCMAPGKVQRHLLTHLEKQTPSVRSYVLCVLTKVLMDFCGGSAQIQQYARTICLVCQDIKPAHVDIQRPRDNGQLRHDASDSALSSSEASLHESGKMPHPKWHCLRQFLPLLRHKDEALSIQVTQHILRLISQASQTFKQHLFHTVFLPLLRQLKKCYLDPGGESSSEQGSNDLSETVIQYCLCALPLLLHSKVAQDLFHNVGGVRLLQALIKNQSLRKCVLKVFQVLIVLEERNKVTLEVHETSDPGTAELADPAQKEEVGGDSLSVCDAFMNIIFTHTPVAHQPEETNEELPRENEGEERSHFLRLPSDQHELSTICDVWNACATLFPSSLQFQQHFLLSKGSESALAVLRSALHNVVNSKEDLSIFVPGWDRGSPFQCWLALIESALFVCLSFCGSKLTADSQNRDDLLMEVQGWLWRSRTMSVVARRAVCDMLLSCATSHRNMRDIVTNHTFAVMHLRIDDSDEREASEVSDYWSTAKESETCHTEQGYEADSEFTPDEHSKLDGEREGRKYVRMMPQPLPTHVMHHPELTRLVLELLIRTPESMDGVLAHVLLRLVSYAKQSAHIASTLYNQGLVQVILDGIKKTVVGGTEHEVERQLLLDLFLLISQHAFSSRELSAFLDLFKNTNIPTGSLLSAATSLAEAFQLKPTYIIVFPVKCPAPPTYDVSVRSLSSDMLAASLNEVPAPSEEQQSEYAQLLRSSNVQEALDLDTGGSLDTPLCSKPSSNKSPVVCAPIQLNLHDSLQWPASDKAFSLSLWLQLEGTPKDIAFLRRSRRPSRPTVEMSAETSLVNPDVVLPAPLRAAMNRSTAGHLWSEQCMHLASMGSEHHRVELWLDPETGSLICRRMVQHEEGEESVAGETCLGGLLGFRCWEHLSVNYHEFITDNSRSAKVTAFVNGCYSREATFDVTHKGQKRRKRGGNVADSTPTNVLMVGHSLPSNKKSSGSWHLGNLLLFRGTVLSQSVSFHMYTLGPDCCSVSQCDSAGLPTEYPRHATRDLLHQTTLNLDLFTTNQTVSLQPLRENLIAMYSPAQAANFNLYRPASLQRSRSTIPPSSGNGLNHQPLALVVNCLADIAAQAHTGLGDAVREIGGIGVFLYLFAWVVEHSAREKEQAQALRLLFTLVSHNPHHAREFTDMGGYSMLAKVLGSDKCIIGYDLLKVLLDAMLTRPVMRYDTATQEYVLQRETTSLIRDVHVVSELLLAWRVWERGSVHVWHTAFRALEYLLRDDHPHQQFNARQLQNIGIVDSLLLICLERIQESYSSLPVPICQSILNITASMLGNPPDVHIIMTICDVLLLIHPAASTYINHAPDEFYFIQKWVQKKSLRRGSHKLAESPLSQSQSLTSTPVNIRPQSSSESVSEVTLSGVFQNQLSRSKSLPSVAESPSFSQRPPSFSRSRTVENCDKDTVDNVQISQQALDLTGHVPALIIDQKKKGSQWETTTVEPVEHLPTDRSSSKAKTSRQLSGDSELVKFYVDTGSERSSTSSVTGPFDNLIPISAESRNKSNSNLNEQTTDRSLNIMQQLSSDSMLNDQRNPALESSEDENGNNVVTGSYQGNHAAARELFSSDNDHSQLSSTGVQDHLLDMAGNSTSIASEGDTPVEEDEEGLVHISVGLLDLLCNILVLLPECDLSKIVGVILKPETLLVMAHHQSPEIRKSIVRLMDMFFHRANVKQKEQFIRQQGFHLLASQLYQHAASQPLLEACFTVLFGRPHALEDDFEASQMADMSRIQKQAVIPILALLESAAAITPVAHSTLVLLMKLLEQVDGLMPVMLENALVETLCNMISTIHASAPRLNNAGADERYVIIEDLQHFFSIIAERSFSTSGIAYYQQFEDSLILLHALEMSETARYGLDSEEVGNIRNIRAHFFRSVFDYLNDRLESSAANGQLTLSSKVGSFLSFLPSKRSTENMDSSSPPSGGSRVKSHQSAPAYMSRLHASSSGSCHSDSPGSASDWTVYGARSPSLSPRGFYGNKKMEIGQGELLERFKKLIVLASEFVMFSVPRRGKQTYIEQRLTRLVKNSIEIVSYEHDFARYLAEFLLNGIVIGMERSFFQKKTLQNTLMWQAKEVLRVQFSSLLANLIAPNQTLGQRLFVIDLLTNEVKRSEVLKLTVNTNNLGEKLMFCQYELLASHLDKFPKTYREDINELISSLERCGLRPLRIGQKISPQARNILNEDQKLWQSEVRRERCHWIKKQESAKNRLLSRMDTFARRISGSAMELTQLVVNAQNAERRKLVEHVKVGMSHRLGVKKAWQELIQQLSHERAVWHCPESYPTSWQLDPTEGPCRVRRRTQRCHLATGKKYLEEGYQDKLDAETKTPPLSYLFEEDMMTSDSAALIYRLHTNEKIQHTCRCTSVTPSSETPGELLIGQNSVYFVGDEAIMDANYTQVLLGNKDLLSMTLPIEDITEIHKRWYQLTDKGLEIFLTNGKTSLLAFENTRERDSLCRLLLSQELPNLIHSENLAAIQQMWLDRRITNFEYLTHLNKMAGRSFNDLMQYPVFPFVLSNYEGDMLDLDAHSTYRNLAKPISVQHKDREEKYIENYKWLAQEKERMTQLEPSLYLPDPYHYGSHYSNSGTVLHFLVRMPPFTQMFLVYQDKNFDLPDRTFHSLHTAWRLASYQSTTDVKELIPEFFYLPEFLNNTEGFAFGQRQDGVQVWDVLLPEWCLGDPRIFTLVHRQALETDYVTNHLAAWIDLVFGFKQAGKPAIDSINVFHPATYFGTDVESISDPVRRTAIKTMIKTYGQTPKQLFKTPHPTPQLHKSPGREKSPALKQVTGLRWGNYVGSTDQADPVMAWSQNHGTRIASLVALPTDDVFGLGQNSCLLVMYSKEKGVTAVNTTDVLWAAIISWNHPDGIIRIQNRRNAPAVNLLHWGLREQVTCCAAVPDCRLLFFGGTSGVVTVFNTKFNADKASNLQVFGRRQCLYGHSGAVTSMYVCKPYSILVTASTDTSAVIWDLNRLCYVRTITGHKHPVQLVSVSDTSGDIATVSYTGRRSVLKLHTVNAALVGSVQSSKTIHCLAFSNAPEGRSVNIIAGGMGDGTIRFWSTWDMSVVRDITWDKFTKPIVSLTFTHDSQRLYAADTDGTVAVFEKPKSPTTKTKPVNFISFL